MHTNKIFVYTISERASEINQLNVTTAEETVYKKSKDGKSSR